MADVSIDATVIGSTARGMRTQVWVSDSVGYQFLINDNADFSYVKTTDGGATWGADVAVGPADTDLAFDVWFDQWTPGNTGTLIHCAWFGSQLDDVLYRTIDTGNSDALGTQRTVATGSTAVADPGNSVSVTVTNSGYIYVAYDLDAGVEIAFRRSTDGGVNWSANLSLSFFEQTDDFAMLFPAQGTGDGNDCWAIYVDASANAITLKLWDSSAASIVESSTITAYIDSTTDLINQHGFSAALRHSDGHLILVASNDRDTATADMVVFDITSTSTFSALTALTANIDDNYYPQVFIDQATDDIYVAYNGKNDGSEVLGTATHIYYRVSTDGGSTWGAEAQYSEGSTTAKVQTWTAPMGPRFYVSWRVALTILGNKVNSVTFGGAQTIAVGQVTEASTAQPVTRLKRAAIGQVTESDAAQAVSRTVLKAVAQASEADAANTVTVNPQHRLVVQVTEADVAQAIARRKTEQIAQTTEADSAVAITRRKTEQLAQATETDVANAIARHKTEQLTQASETDAAQVIVRSKRLSLAQASETDAAQDVTSPSVNPIVAQVLETDAAVAVVRAKSLALGQSSETDSASAVAHRKTEQVAQATELDSAVTIMKRKAEQIAQAVETDSAQTLAHLKRRAIASVAELDSAQTVTSFSNNQVISVAQVMEVDSARATVLLRAFPLGQATENDSAGSILVFIQTDDISELRLLRIAAEDRVLLVSAEGRAYVVALEDRELSVLAEGRAYVVVPEDRAHAVPGEQRAQAVEEG